MEGPLWELVKQLAIGTPALMALTEWLFPAPGNWKRLTAVFWSIVISYALWITGTVELPAILHVCSGAESFCWHQHFILTLAATINAAVALGIHGGAEFFTSKGKEKRRLKKLKKTSKLP